MDQEAIAVPNELAQNLKVAEEDESARFDASAKKLIAEKSILAYILKSALSEYGPYSVLPTPSRNAASTTRRG